jgi:hypothetical protein
MNSEDNTASERVAEFAEGLWEIYYDYYRKECGVPSKSNRQGSHVSECRYHATFMEAAKTCVRIKMRPSEFFYEMLHVKGNDGRAITPQFLLNAAYIGKVTAQRDIDVDEQWKYQSVTLLDLVDRYLDNRPDADMDTAIRAVLLSADTPFTAWFRVKLYLSSRQTA